MTAGSLRAVAVGCSLALAAVAAAGCASSSARVLTREQRVRAALTDDLSLSGRMLVNDLGQHSAMRLRTGATRVSEDLILLEDVHHRLHVLNRATLTSRWEFHGIDDPLRYPATTSDISVLAMSGNRLHQVDRRYGHDTGGAVHFDLTPSAPFVATAGTAFVPAWGGGRGEKTLRTLNLVTGLEGWGYRTPGDIRGAMALGGDAPRQMVYFATDAGDVYALPAVGADAPAPEITWKVHTHGAVTADLHLAGDDLFVSSRDSGLYAIDRIGGTVRWATFLGTPLTESAVATASRVYVWTSAGLNCLDRATGRLLWTSAECRRFVVEREGRSVLQCADGSLVAVREDGSVAARTNAGRYAFPANTVDGTLYAVGEDGYLVALEVGGE